MKRSILLAIIPVVWVILASITIASVGRFSPFDPDYYYLLSSLDLARLNTLGTYHHPGTTAITFGAAVIRVAHLFQHTPDDLQTALLKDPESFMVVINGMSALLNALGLLVMGLVAFKVTENLWLSLLLQLSPFLSAVVPLETLARFKPETFMLFACLLFIALVIVYVYSEKRSSRVVTLAFAAVCGFGVATKFTFLPVVVIPLVLLAGLKEKARFLVGTLLATIVFTLPIANSYSRLWTWTSGVAFHTGRYGEGAVGIIDTQAYPKTFAALLGNNTIFVVIMVFGLVAILPTVISDYAGRARRPSRPALKALGAIFLSQIIGFVLVAKYYISPDANRYLFTSYCLLGLTLLLSVRQVLSVDFHLARTAKYILLAILAIAVFPYLETTTKQVSDSILNWRAARDSYTARQSNLAFLDGDGFKDYARVFDMGYRTFQNGLFQASYYSIAQQPALRRLYGNTYFCSECTEHNWQTKTMTSFEYDKSWSAEQIMARYDGRIVFIYGTAPTVYVMDPSHK